MRLMMTISTAQNEKETENLSNSDISKDSTGNSDSINQITSSTICHEKQINTNSKKQ